MSATYGSVGGPMKKKKNIKHGKKKKSCHKKKKSCHEKKKKS